MVIPLSWGTARGSRHVGFYSDIFLQCLDKSIIREIQPVTL